MQLPFSLSFFREIDIFQKLSSYEKENKSTWKAEKEFLVWIVSSKHQHRGTHLDYSHVIDALLKPRFIKQELLKDFVSYDKAGIILEALETRSLGKIIDRADTLEKRKIMFYEDAYIAGKILCSTDNLKNTWKYSIWINIWWVVFISALVLLLSQTINSLVELVGKVVNICSH